MTIRQKINDMGGRKFCIAAFFAWIDAVALFTGHLTGTEFLSLAGLILGLYGLANVGQRKVMRDQTTDINAGEVKITIPQRNGGLMEVSP